MPSLLKRLPPKILLILAAYALAATPRVIVTPAATLHVGTSRSLDAPSAGSDLSGCGGERFGFGGRLDRGDEAPRFAGAARAFPLLPTEVVVRELGFGLLARDPFDFALRVRLTLFARGSEDWTFAFAAFATFDREVPLEDRLALACG